jgi:hypothetical protein
MLSISSEDSLRMWGRGLGLRFCSGMEPEDSGFGTLNARISLPKERYSVLGDEMR